MLSSLIQIQEIRLIQLFLMFGLFRLKILKLDIKFEYSLNHSHQLPLKSIQMEFRKELTISKLCIKHEEDSNQLSNLSQKHTKLVFQQLQDQSMEVNFLKFKVIISGQKNLILQSDLVRKSFIQFQSLSLQ